MPDDSTDHAVKMIVASCVIATAFALLSLRLIEVNQAEGQVMLNYCLLVFICLTLDTGLGCLFVIPFAFEKLESVRKILPTFTKVVWAGKAGWCFVAAIEFGKMAIHYLAAL